MAVLRSIPGLASAAALAATLAVGLLPLSTTPAEAQVYYSIYGGYRNAPPAPYRDDRPRFSSNPFSDFFGSLFGRRPSGVEEEDHKPDAFANHCVRTCDGKFFPVNRGGRKDISLEKVCSAMCPAAQTKIFSGLGIEQAVAPDGQRYSALPNAFAYRTKIVDDCTCNGRDPFGVAKVDLDNDPTLQGGDLVVQSSGFSVYRSNGDFVPLEQSGMNPAFVKQMLAIKILPDNPHATFATTMPVQQPGPDDAEKPASVSPDAPVPNANAPAANQQPARAN